MHDLQLLSQYLHRQTLHDLQKHAHTHVIPFIFLLINTFTGEFLYTLKVCSTDTCTMPFLLWHVSITVSLKSVAEDAHSRHSCHSCKWPKSSVLFFKNVFLVHGCFLKSYFERINVGSREKTHTSV